MGVESSKVNRDFGRGGKELSVYNGMLGNLVERKGCHREMGGVVHREFSRQGGDRGGDRAKWAVYRSFGSGVGWCDGL